jgi:membrane protease subunit HflC
MRKVLILIVGIVVFLWLLGSALFTVDRAEFVYLTQFGRHVATYDGKTDAGLHIKWPWPIQSVIRLDNRLQFFDLREVELLTHDPRGKTIDKTLMISPYVCWRIAAQSGAKQADGVDQFVRAVSTPERAKTILEQRILSRLGAEVGKMSMDDLISALPETPIKENMAKLRQHLLGIDEQGNEVAGSDSLRRLAREQYGIELVDIQLRRYNHPLSVRSDIYARIVSERDKKAAEYTSEGLKLATDIESQARREARDIETSAKAQKKRLEEGAAVKADAIRNQAHSKDPEFYTFLQKLEAYQTMLGSSRDVLLLSSDHELFDLLLKPPKLPSGANGKMKPAPAVIPASYEALPPPRVIETPPKTSGGP